MIIEIEIEIFVNGDLICELWNKLWKITFNDL